jgi:transcriptional regulator with XRE-family HTH domain
MPGCGKIVRREIKMQIREAVGLSQRKIAERLAERAGVKITHKNISKYERDKASRLLKLYLPMLALRMSR